MNQVKVKPNQTRREASKKGGGGALEEFGLDGEGVGGGEERMDDLLQVK